MTVSHPEMLAICGLTELAAHSANAITDILTIIDPLKPDPTDFLTYPEHDRRILRFHDEIAPRPGYILPQEQDIAEIIAFGDAVYKKKDQKNAETRLLVHCHMGMSRSTAAMAIILAKAQPHKEADALFSHLQTIRKQSWPNSLMIAMADDMLGRKGELLLGMRRFYGRQLQLYPTYAQSLQTIGRSAEVDMAIAP